MTEPDPGSISKDQIRALLREEFEQQRKELEELVALLFSRAKSVHVILQDDVPEEPHQNNGS